MRFVRDATGNTVASADLRLNEPHFIKLSDILKAECKPIETFELATHGGEIKTMNYAPPPKRSREVMVKDTAELVSMLKQKGLI